MAYTPPSQGRGDRRLNTTNYEHPQETNLLDVARALQYRYLTGEPELRVNLGSNAFVISGNVIIPGIVQVFSTIDNPIHNHVTEVGTSGNLQVPWLPVAGNVRLDAGTNSIGNVRITDMPGVFVTNFPSNIRITDMPGITGNVGVSGNVSITQLPGITGNVVVTQGTTPWVVSNSNVSIIGNITGITTLPAITGNVGVSGNVRITDMPGVTGNVHVYGGNVQVTQGTTPWTITGNVGITGTANVVLAEDASVVISGFGGATSDAFGRLRVSEPYTLFDTSARYYDHGQFSNVNVGTANVVYVANQSSFQLNVGTANGDSVIRESKKVFPYQPGKSQLTLNTFCFATPKTNLRQRVGLFGANDGVFFENDGTYNYMVIRSGSTGVEERVRQDAWNGDRLNGLGGVTNPSGITLFPDRAQIFHADIEWLGVGSVRVGFVIDGAFIICHTFNHANQPGNTKVYMTTATLPIRYEITNTGVTANASMMTQICSTVISEGGYNNFGTTQSAGTGTTPKRLSNSGTYYPIVSIRLNSSRLDSIVFPRQIDVLSPSVNYYRWVLFLNSTLTGATFATTSPTGTVDIDVAATALSDGIEIQSGYASAREVQILSAVDYFQFQLGRTVTGVSDIVTLAIAATANNADVLAELGWQELT
jgi:hypothetical protein